MKAVVCLVALLAVSCFAEDVEVLTDSTFDAFLQANPLVLVEFYAPWCGHCKKLDPEYSKAATELKGKEIVLAKVDATVETKLAERFKIEGFPTLKLFRDGQPKEYEGGRTTKEIVSYLEKQLGPAVTTVSTADELAALIPKEAGSAPIIVAYLNEGSDDAKFFDTFAKSNRDDYKFVHVSSQAIADSQKAKLGSIVLYKSFDEKHNVYEGKSEAQDLLTFLKNYSIKLVDEITPGNYKSYIGRGLPIAWLFVDPKAKEDTDAAIAQLEEVASEFRGDVSLVHLNGVQYAQMVTKMALSGKKLPALAIETQEGEHYTFDEDKQITASELRQWLGHWKSGNLQAKVRSEPVPEQSHDESNVRVLVGQNFVEVVNDKSKDVLVEFYAPYCGHCKRLEPIYAELAQSLKETDEIVVAKMDGTTNDAPASFKVNGYPTLVLVKGETNEHIPYNGARTKEDLLQFLQTNAHHGSKIKATGGNDEL